MDIFAIYLTAILLKILLCLPVFSEPNLSLPIYISVLFPPFEAQIVKKVSK